MDGIAQLISRIYRHRRFSLLAACLITAAVLAAYANTFHAVFQFDDEAHIHENPAVKAVTRENVKTLLRTTRPVTDLSLMLNYAVSGLNVVGWHVFNTVLHIANAVLVYFLVLSTLLLPVFRGKYDDKARGMALFTALLFAVHPVQTEAVTYIISRSELLATFFYLAAMLLFIASAKDGERPGRLFGMLAASLLAMGSKEWAVTLPAVLALYDLLFLSEGGWRPLLRRWRSYLAVTLVPWFLIIYVAGLTLRGSASGVGFNLSPAAGLTPWTYFLTSLNVLWTYVRLLLLPVGQNLDYDYPVARTLFGLPTLLSAIGHAAVVAGAVRYYRRTKEPLIPFGIAWFYIGLSPVQSFVPIIDVIFEHRLYLPSIGLFLAFVTAADPLFARFEQGRDRPPTAARRTGRT